MWGQDCVDGVEVELWGECYNIEETTVLDFYWGVLTGEIPSEIGRMTDLDYLYLHFNELTTLPESICNLDCNLPIGIKIQCSYNF